MNETVTDYEIVVLDSPLVVDPGDAGRVKEVLLSAQPRVGIWLVSSEGARAVEHGYRYLRLL